MYHVKSVNYLDIRAWGDNQPGKLGGRHIFWTFDFILNLTAFPPDKQLTHFMGVPSVAQ